MKNTSVMVPSIATSDWSKRRSRKRLTRIFPQRLMTRSPDGAQRNPGQRCEQAAPAFRFALCGLRSCLLLPGNPVDEEALVRCRLPAQFLAGAVEDRDLIERHKRHRLL